MAKKITIEVLDPKYETTAIGSTSLIDENNLPNKDFNNPLYTSNMGLAGCSLSYDSLEQNWNSANGAPAASWWKPWAYDSAAPPSPGFCVLAYRDTPLPYESGGQLIIPGSIINNTEYVVNGEFNGVVNAQTGMGFIETTQTEVPGFGINPIIQAITVDDAIGPPLNSDQAWYSTYTRCTPGFGLQSPTNNGVVSLMTPGKCGIPEGDQDTCSGGGSYSQACIYQEIQGLTPGTWYRLEFRLDVGDSAGQSYMQAGWSGPPLTSPSGIDYIPLGGFNADIYGTGAGSLWGGVNAPGGLVQDGHFTTANQIHSGYFIAQGGNEVLCLNYLTWNDSGATYPDGGASPIRFDYISIKEGQDQAINYSGVYSVAQCWDSNINAVPTVAVIRIDVDSINNSYNTEGDAIVINEHQPPFYQQALGLQALHTSPIILTNNPGLGGTHPLVLGNNIITIPLNQTASVAPFGTYDRLFEMTFVNVLGNTIALNSCDVEFHSSSTPTTWQTIDRDKSMVGVLEVSNSEDFPLSISYTISDGKDLETRFGDYSQTFDLPATANNNKILNYIWNAGVSQADKLTWGVKNCTVNVDGVPFFKGSLQVKKSSHDSTPKSYSCTLYGGNFSWMSLLKDKELCEVFPAGETFDYDYAAIESQWSNSLSTSSTENVQYPIISWRDFNIGGPQNYINTYVTNKPPDIQPAFYTHSIITKIFENIGYKISSNFMDTDHVKKLITPFPFISNSFKDDNIHFSCEQRINSGISNYHTNQAHTGLGSLTTGWTTVKLAHNVTDPSQSYDNSSGVFTCQKAGTYDVVAQNSFVIELTSDAGPGSCAAYVSGSCDWEYTAIDPCDSWTWATRVKVTTAASGVSYVNTGPGGIGQTSGSPLHYGAGGCYCWDTSTQYTIVPSGTVTLGVGDTIELQGKHIGQNLCGCEPKVNTQFGYTATTQANGGVEPRMTITYTGAVPSIGDPIEKNDILPCGVSQVEYLKAIAHLFNLYFTTDVQAKTVYIEPFNDFFEPTSKAMDWSTKVDFSQDIEDNYDVGLKRELQIGYKVDGGDKYAKVQNDEANQYGDATRRFDYNENLGVNFESGKVEMTNNLFASSTQVWDNDAHDDTTNSKAPILIPNLWTEDCYSGIGMGNNQWRPPNMIEPFVPRIFYYEWIDTTVAGPNPGGVVTYWSRQTSSGSMWTNNITYPRATFVDWEEVSHSTTMRPSLSFEDEIFTAPGQNNVTNTPGLYTFYYKNMVEQLKQAPRIRTVYINLKVSDILNLDMRRLIQIDSTIWRINKIVGFSPANNQSTKVELIQWIEVGFWPVIRDRVEITYA